MPEISQELLKANLSYSPDTGLFYRISDEAKKPLGYLNSDGYLHIRVAGFRCLAHRLAWIYCNGFLGRYQIDHINKVKTDNRICNLRKATNAENAQNRAKPLKSKSGVIGVHSCARSGKWVSTIRHLGKTHYLGRFDSIELASKAYAEAKAKYHTFHPYVP